MNYDQAFDALIGNEGGYSFNAADPGGETMWGITSRVARRNGYTSEMRLLPRDAPAGKVSAKSIARAEYWDVLHTDTLPAVLRFQVFDAAYNSGPVQAVKFLQRAAGVEDDGLFGPGTQAAVAGASGVEVILIAILFDVERQEYLAALPTWPAFGRGWARRIAANLRTLVRELKGA